MSDGGNGTKQFRLVLVGSGRVGKTSLVWRFIHDRFCCQYQPTIEDSYRQLIQLPGSFIHSFIYSFVRSFIHSFIYSFIPSLIPSFRHSLIGLSAQSSVHSFSCFSLKSLIHSFTHSIIHSFICSFVHSLATTTTLSHDSNDNDDDDYTSFGFDWMELEWI